MKQAQINYETLKRTHYTVWVRNYKTGPTDFEIKQMNLIRMYLMKTLWKEIKDGFHAYFRSLHVTRAKCYPEFAKLSNGWKY